ncbi:ANTH-domain-containing protein [Microthyrium microscopicum]|uniref:ANTH-domain-containing protein n=1 Tax=Microthyrium microscopicum TaxID=703497 RepID=A0A6A6U1W6_9PEZI|nr:ANTH-domain-containing protein [Microthyrium microscopicum]
MSSGWEKSVKGATKIKLAAPKSKYIEHILIATHTGEAGVAEIFRALQNRLRDSTWTIVFKALIVVHFMVREGQEEVTLKYLSSNPHRKLAINNFTEVQTQGRNIRTYADYLTQRAVSYSTTKNDYVRSGEGRLKTLAVDKGLLRETESVQDQIKALCRCDFLSHEPENEITLTAFRLLTMDLLALFHVMNEGTITVLEKFFEMSKTDAERALRIYRSFVKQTEQVVRYLSIARHYDHATRLEIPKIKHAPTSLTSSLEEYLKDPEFEKNRRQYLAQQDAKKNGKTTNGATKTLGSKATSSNNAAFPDAKPQQTTQSSPQKGPAPDMIDFFESIEQNQQPIAQQSFQQPQFGGQMPPSQQNSYPPQQNPFLPQQTGMPIQQPQMQAPNPFLQQQTGFGMQQPVQPVGQPMQQPFNSQPQQSNPFLQLQTQQPQQPQQQSQQTPTSAVSSSYTGGPSPFGNFSPQVQSNSFSSNLSTIPQGGAASFQPQPQQAFPTGATNASSAQSTNPFRQSMLGSSTTGTSMSSFSTVSPLSAQPTGSTNPFAKPAQANPFARGPAGQPQPQQQSSPFTSAAPLVPAATGTNPFRQSAFVNQNTGAGWQTSTPQGTIGGIPSERVETMPIFPRPGMG